MNEPMQVGCAHCRDRWAWVMVYRDGTRITECAPDKHRVLADVDLDQVAALGFIPVHPVQTGLPKVVVQLPDPEMKPILFRRGYVALSLDGDEATPPSPIRVVGYTVGGREFLAMITGDGSVVLTGNLQAVPSEQLAAI